ncbi:Txe/YoeB family addiction module toxin [Brooklawnia sp.]|uniref:Txe/YoeB family addiction module toxin n=1 Tax=Brooklawnia sp. TaxID=2699740 RepID=UPI00311D67E4
MRPGRSGYLRGSQLSGQLLLAGRASCRRGLTVARGDPETPTRTVHLGLVKPEPLRHAFAGSWSRRITDEHRLIYGIAEDQIRVASCRYHYGR